MIPRPRRIRSLDAISRDDAFLDALGRGEPPDPSDPLALALSDWRRDIVDTPLSATPEPALTVLRRRVGRGITVAAVVSAVGLGSVTGMAAAATQAQPGSALWPITRMVAPERAESRQAAYQARDWMDRAAAAAAEDRREQAARYLAQAEADAGRVRGDDGADALRDRAAELRRQLEGSETGAGTGSRTESPAPEESPTVTPSAEPTQEESTAPPRPIFRRSTPPSPSEPPAESPAPSPAPSESSTPSASPSPSQSEPGLLELLLPGVFTGSSEGAGPQDR